MREDTLSKLGLSDLFADALRHRSTVWFREGKQVLHADLPFPALGISRFAMDALMAEKFQKAGGKLNVKSECSEADRAGLVWATGRKRERGEWLGLKMHCRDYTLAETSRYILVSRHMSVHLRLRMGASMCAGYFAAFREYVDEAKRSFTAT